MLTYQQLARRLRANVSPYSSATLEGNIVKKTIAVVLVLMFGSLFSFLVTSLVGVNTQGPEWGQIAVTASKVLWGMALTLAWQIK
jgi:hypothetical protein